MNNPLKNGAFRIIGFSEELMRLCEASVKCVGGATRADCNVAK